MKTEISVEHMHAAALLYRKARAVINVPKYARGYEKKLDDLKNAIYQYEESIQSEVVRLHKEL